MGSLKLRLTLLVGACLLLLLATQAAGLRIIPRALVEDYVITRLEHDADTLYARLVDGTEPADVFARTVGLVYETPLSGHYFRIDTGETVIRSRSLWDEDLPLPSLAPRELRVSRLPGPAEQSLLVYGRGYQVRGQPVTISVAEDVGVMERTVARLERQLLAAMSVAIALVLLLQFLLIRRALRPLDEAVAACRRLESGGAAPLEVRAPQEISPLVVAINRLIHHQGLRLERTRRALGNVSHTLKTPIAVMGQLADELAERGERSAAEALRVQLEQMRNTVEREMRRARLAGSGQPGAGFDARTEFRALVEVLRQLHRGRVDMDVKVEGDPVPVDREDMLELFGNLLDNACRWAASKVSVSVRQDPGIDAVVEDDGPGVEEAMIGRLVQPGFRLDERTPGHGLGLAIARDVVEQYGGWIEFGRSTELGGLKVEVHIPQPRALMQYPGS